MEQEKKYNKVGEWLHSDAEPMIDLSGMSATDKASLLKLVMRWKYILTPICFTSCCWKTTGTYHLPLVPYWRLSNRIVYKFGLCAWTHSSVSYRQDSRRKEEISLEKCSRCLDMAGWYEHWDCSSHRETFAEIRRPAFLRWPQRPQWPVDYRTIYYRQGFVG